MKIILKIISLIIIPSLLIFPQKKDPDEILNEVISKFQKVNDYQVDVNIIVDVEFLKVPESNAKIYFKQPDKISLKSDGFAMLPRKGFDFSPTALLKGEFTAIYERDDNLNGVKTAVIKVIPLGNSDDIILSTLWVDEEKSIIRKIESTTKMNGTFTIDLTYEDSIKYALPSQMVFSFNIDKMNLPSTMIGESDTKKRRDKKPSDTLTKGKVKVIYSNYIINKGVPDSVFTEKNE